MGSPLRVTSRHTMTSRRSSTVRSNSPASPVRTGAWAPTPRASSSLSAASTRAEGCRARSSLAGIRILARSVSRTRPAARAARAWARPASGWVRAVAASSPRPSTSRAPREPMWATRSVSWAGQERVLGQRRSTSPSLAGARAVPQEGQASGITKTRSEPSRTSRTGATISGMTSPALRRTTRSPMRTPLRATSVGLCRVARDTVDPATRTGSIMPNGVTRPVRPTWTSMSSSRVRTSSGGYL